MQALFQVNHWIPVEARKDYKLQPSATTSSIPHPLPTSMTFSLSTPLPGSFVFLQTHGYFAFLILKEPVFLLCSEAKEFSPFWRSMKTVLESRLYKQCCNSATVLSLFPTPSLKPNYIHCAMNPVLCFTYCDFYIIYYVWVLCIHFCWSCWELWKLPLLLLWLRWQCDLSQILRLAPIKTVDEYFGAGLFAVALFDVVSFYS